MTGINPLGATIADISIVESQMSFDGLSDGSEIYPAISIKSCLVDQSTDDSMQYVGVESTISVGAATTMEGSPAMIARLIVGCTVRAPIELCGAVALPELERYAVEANVGFARAVVYQQTMTSILPTGLIIPPMAFDGEMEVTREP